MIEDYQNLLNECLDLTEDYQMLMIMKVVLEVMKDNRKELAETFPQEQS